MKKNIFVKKILKIISILGFWVPDTIYVRIWYFYRSRRWLNLKKPKRFTEKINWLKLYEHGRNPIYSILSDKYEVRKFVEDKIGKQYLIPLIGVWEKFEDIDFSKFPNQFVLKCTHDSGSVVVCKNKNAFDYKFAQKKLSRALRENYYLWSREKAYKSILPRIIAEQYIEDEAGHLNEYKFYCFDGEIKLIMVNYDRFKNVKSNLYTPEWEYVHGVILFPTDPDHIIPKPPNLDLMLDLSINL